MIRGSGEEAQANRPASLAFVPLAATVIRPRSSPPVSVTSIPAARNGGAGDKAEVEDQLDLIFWQQERRHIPGEFRPLSAKQAARHLFRVAGIDRSPGRARRPERQTAKLQTRRRLLGAFLDEIEGKAAHFRSFSSSRTSRPLMMAPTGLITSWHTLEQRSAAKSKRSRAGAFIDHPFVRQSRLGPVIKIRAPELHGVACLKLLPQKSSLQAAGARLGSVPCVKAQFQFAKERLTNHYMSARF